MTEKGIKGLVATFDSFDEVVIGEMKEIIGGILADPWSVHHNYKESLKDVDSFLRVVDWYSCSKGCKVYRESIAPMYDALVELAFPKTHGPLEISVLDVRDMPDGGAAIVYEASPAMKEFLMCVGFQKILEDACKEVVGEKASEQVPGWEYYTGLNT